MSKLKITLTGVGVLCVVLLAFIGYTSGSTAKLSDEDIARSRVRAQVFEVCNISRTTDGISEEMCGKIQDTTNTEYLCKLRNQSPVNHCWVENK
jgi:hypothetical protein